MLLKHKKITIKNSYRIFCNNDILIGAYLLLGNNNATSYHFNKMPLAEQNSFKKYPINIFFIKGEQKDSKYGVTL
jgi:hypothetical protein